MLSHILIRDFFFTMMASVFGLTLIITHFFLKWVPELEDHFRMKNKRTRAMFFGAAILGGWVSSMIGSGIDMIVFTVMSIAFGLHERRAIPTSVCIMATLSVYGFFLHAIPNPDSIGRVWDYWAVCIPIVAVGAPVGAYVASVIKREIFVVGVLLLIATEFISTLILIPLDKTGVTIMVSTALSAALAFWGMTRFRRARLAHEESLLGNIS